MLAYNYYNNNNQFQDFSTINNHYTKYNPTIDKREQRDADIYIDNISKETSKTLLWSSLEKYGKIAGISLKTKNNKFGAPIGQHAYVWCQTEDDKEAILKFAVHDSEIANMFFIVPIIKEYKRIDERKSSPQSQVQSQAKFKTQVQTQTKSSEIKLEVVEPKSKTSSTVHKVNIKDREAVRDQLIEIVFKIVEKDEDRMKIIDLLLEIKTVSSNTLKFLIPNKEKHLEEIEKICEILTKN